VEQVLVSNPFLLAGEGGGGSWRLKKCHMYASMQAQAQDCSEQTNTGRTSTRTLTWTSFGSSASQRYRARRFPISRILSSTLLSHKSTTPKLRQRTSACRCCYQEPYTVLGKQLRRENKKKKKTHTQQIVLWPTR
jgi:hypothetical protein